MRQPYPNFLQIGSELSAYVTDDGLWLHIYDQEGVDMRLDQSCVLILRDWLNEALTAETEVKP